MSATEITLPGAGAGFPARAGAVLRGALRVIGAIVIATIATILLLASLAPGGIRAGAQTTAAGPAARAEPPPAAGLFFRAARDDAVFEAPTLASDVRIAVNGLISRVTVRQHFVNPSNAWMEGIYVFPLPERSAVDRLTMTVGGREIAGRSNRPTATPSWAARISTKKSSITSPTSSRRNRASTCARTAWRCSG